MKKILLTTLALMGALTMTLRAEATADQWAQYAGLRDAQKPVLQQIESGSYQGDVAAVTAFAAKYEEIATLTSAMGRPDITAWQYNNAAYALIKYIKASTAWDATMDSIKVMPTSTKDERQAKLQAARDIQSKVKGFVDLLNLASGYLQKAENVEGADDAVGNKIESNQQFVDWALEFAGKKL